MSETFPLVIVGQKGYELSPELKKSLTRRTPKAFIEKDPKGFDYVQVGYVRRTLDSIFPMSWSFTVELVTPWDFIKAAKQLAVKGTLTIIHPETRQVLRVVENYGSSVIKTYRQDHPTQPGGVMDIANDLKAAEADALKKCASMLGIAQDIYEPKVQAKVDAAS